MPFNQVMSKFKKSNLHSGSKSGPVVKDRKQALAIMLSEKRSGKEEYSAGPSAETKKKMFGKKGKK
jgi:hypothetical protein